MKKWIMILACLSLGGSRLLAREFRTPLNLQQGMYGHLHVPLELDDEDLEHKIQYDVWGGAYAQSANQVYNECHHKVNVAQIFFGKENFHGADVFFDSKVTSSNNPASAWLTFATLSPRVEYNENGAVFGGEIRSSWNDTLRFGLRVNLPYKVVEFHKDENDCGCGLGEETIEDVCIRQSDLFVANTDPRVTQGSTIDNDWAWRLDFLSALCSSSCTIPLVKYGTGAGNPTRIDGRDVTETGNLSPDPNFVAGNPVHLVQISVGDVPTGLLAAPWDPTVMALPFLDGAGTGPGDGNRTRFASGTDYTTLAGNMAAQSKFWLVPTLVQNGAANELATSADANQIRNMIEQLIDTIDTSAVDFFIDRGISFDTQKTRGIGDLDTQLFAGCMVRDDCYAEAQLGVRFPTGKRIKKPNLLYKTPTGNNGHYEIELGAMAWWKPIDCVALKGDASYHWVLERSERVAAAFKGATVKNINPILDADISWRYFIGHLDLTFIHPENPGLGLDIGYEFYWKNKDDICFKGICDIGDCEDNKGVPFSTINGTNATDFFGNSEPLDPCVLAKFTNRISNKLRIEFFHHWNFGDLYMGWSQVFHGKNIMRETSYYIGMSINF
jgi:hypothetical protein